MRDLGDRCTAWDVYHSEEMQWLRHACSRNRARIIAKACTAMKIRFPAMMDYSNATPGEMMAIVCTESIHHDLKTPRQHHNSDIQVLNYCACTGYHPNGIVCGMAPWEGLWIFHGIKSYNNVCDEEGFGRPYGALFLPTAAPQIPLTVASTEDEQRKRGACGKANHHHYETHYRSSVPRLELLNLWGNDQAIGLSSVMMECLQILDHPCDLVVAQINKTNEDDDDLSVAYKRSIARLTTAPAAVRTGQTTTLTSSNKQRYLRFDEPLLQSMSKKGWNRALGYTPLITLACGLARDWFQYKLYADAERHGQEEHAKDLNGCMP